MERGGGGEGYTVAPADDVCVTDRRQLQALDSWVAAAEQEVANGGAVVVLALVLVVPGEEMVLAAATVWLSRVLP